MLIFFSRNRAYQSIVVISSLTPNIASRLCSFDRLTIDNRSLQQEQFDRRNQIRAATIVKAFIIRFIPSVSNQKCPFTATFLRPFPNGNRKPWWKPHHKLRCKPRQRLKPSLQSCSLLNLYQLLQSRHVGCSKNASTPPFWLLQKSLLSSHNSHSKVRIT